MTPPHLPPDLFLYLDEPPPAAGGGLAGMFLPIVAMIAIFYFLLYRPQRKEQEEHQKFLAGLVRGDRVVTASGLHGRVQEVRGEVVLLEVAADTVVTVERESVRRKAKDAAPDPKPGDAAAKPTGKAP